METPDGDGRIGEWSYYVVGSAVEVALLAAESSAS
jgi:hypothetical protein